MSDANSPGICIRIEFVIRHVSQIQFLSTRLEVEREVLRIFLEGRNSGWIYI